MLLSFTTAVLLPHLNIFPLRNTIWVRYGYKIIFSYVTSNNYTIYYQNYFYIIGGNQGSTKYTKKKKTYTETRTNVAFSLMSKTTLKCLNFLKNFNELKILSSYECFLTQFPHSWNLL